MSSEAPVPSTFERCRHGIATGLAITLALLLAPAARADTSLPDLFRQGKGQFDSGHYAKSLATFQKIDKVSQQSGYEQDRKQLEAPLHFFLGANLAMLKRHDEAVGEFSEYLRLNPQASLSAGSFPRRVMHAFEDAQQQGAASESRAESAYEAFRRQEGSTPETTAVSADWAKSAVRFLMTDEETAAWKAATTDAARAAFVKGFWKKR
jgi:tetratricopeptide (TPR) repeat protein